MQRVIGLGGPFLQSRDPQALADWYEKHLGIPFKGKTYADWPFADGEGKPRAGFNLLSFFKTDSAYFHPSEKTCMLNLIVHDLYALLAVLAQEGVTIIDKPLEEDYGKFAWILDPEGNKIELWEPPARQ